MKVLGIDPGVARLGFGIVEYKNHSFQVLEFGCIETAKEKDPGERLAIIVYKLEKIIKKHKPEVLGIEEIFFNQNIKTAISVAQSKGVVLWLAHKYKLKIRELKPTEVKQAVCSVGNAPKSQVQKMVTLMLNLKEAPKLDDTADALACAIAAAGNQNNF